MYHRIKHALRQRVGFVIYTYALFYLFRYSIAIADVPRVRLIEYAICQRYYRQYSKEDSHVPESQCKQLPIQVELATITGWRLSLDALPSMSNVSCSFAACA